MTFNYPRAWASAHAFQFFNAVAFSIMMGAPVVVFAKSLGASSVVLGIIASFTPLMNVLQLPAARYLGGYGYREFVLMGWGARTVFIFVVSTVPLLGVVSQGVRLGLLVVALLCFNILRGISSAAWLPWMAALIPEDKRGRFFSVDQLFMYAGCLFALLASGLVMRGEVGVWEFSLVFLIAAVGGAASLLFIRRIPEVLPGAAGRRGPHSVPWKAILGHAPFRAVVIFNLLNVAVLGSMGVFTVEYLRDQSHLEVASVLFLSAFSFLGALCALPFVGVVIDGTGSKPLLRAATAAYSVVVAGWFLIAARLLPGAFWIVLLLNVLTGAASASFNLSNLRMVMAAVPEMGREHFFALFSVLTSLGMGASPIVWGIALDALGTFEVVTGAFHWKRHSIYFLALLVTNAFAFAYIPRLHESPGAKERGLPPRPRPEIS